MRRMLGPVIVLVCASPAAAQFGYPPLGYSTYGHGHAGGFAVAGRHFAFAGSWGGYSYGTTFTPYGYGFPYGYAPPAVIVVQPVGGWFAARPTVGFAGNVGLAVKPREPAPPPADPLADVRVDAAVKRGDYVVIRPGDAVKVNGGRPPVEPLLMPKFAKDEPGFFAADPEVLPKDPKARATFEVDRAKTAFAAGQYGRAAERLADAIRATPEDPLPYFLLAQARTARGEYVEAVAAIRDGMKRAPDWPASKFDPTTLYRNRAFFADHLADLKQSAVATPDDPTLGFLFGYHLWFTNDKPSAIKQFRTATRLTGDNAVIERFLVEVDS